MRLGAQRPVFAQIADCIAICDIPQDILGSIPSLTKRVAPVSSFSGKRRRLTDAGRRPSLPALPTGDVTRPWLSLTEGTQRVFHPPCLPGRWFLVENHVHLRLVFGYCSPVGCSIKMYKERSKDITRTRNSGSFCSATRDDRLGQVHETDAVWSG